MDQQYVLDKQELEIRCNKLIRLRTFLKHGLGYFEPIVEQIRKTGKCDINKQEFDRNLELAKDNILNVYQQEKDKQKKYNCNRNKQDGNVSQISQQSSQNNSIQIGEIQSQISTQSSTFSNYSGGSINSIGQQIIKVICANAQTQTDNDWIINKDKEAQRLNETMDKVILVKKRLENEQLQMKQKESRLNITIDKKDKKILEIEQICKDKDAKLSQYRKDIEQMRQCIEIHKKNEIYFKEQMGIKDTKQNKQK